MARSMPYRGGKGNGGTYQVIHPALYTRSNYESYHTQHANTSIDGYVDLTADVFYLSLQRRYFIRPALRLGDHGTRPSIIIQGCRQLMFFAGLYTPRCTRDRTTYESYHTACKYEY